jgi:hypothetical protein
MERVFKKRSFARLKDSDVPRFAKSCSGLICSFQFLKQNTIIYSMTTTTTSLLLPPEVLVRVFSILGNVQDLGRVQLVCRSFHTAAGNETIWCEIAIRKYGAYIHDQTVHLYDGSSYEMLKDDNRLGACPIIYNPDSLCLYKYNRDDYWFGCLIRWVRWHRQSRTVQIYVDARGERDLRHPSTSGVWRSGIVAVDVDEMDHNGAEGSSEHLPSRPHAFDNLLADEQQRPRGHYKGVLIYPEELFLQPAEYVFCYANGHVISPWERRLGGAVRDYTKTVILRFGPQENLKDAFPEYSLEAAPTNDDDNDDEEESDRERWRLHVPAAVMNRTQPSPWWV